MTPNHTQQTLTEAAELADDVGQADIGDTFQLTADVGRDGLATQVSRLYIPRNQRHGGVLSIGGPNPEVGRGSGSFKPKTYKQTKDVKTKTALACITDSCDTYKLRNNNLSQLLKCEELLLFSFYIIVN